MITSLESVEAKRKGGDGNCVHHGVPTVCFQHDQGRNFSKCGSESNTIFLVKVNPQVAVVGSERPPCLPVLGAASRASPRVGPRVNLNAGKSRTTFFFHVRVCGFGRHGSNSRLLMSEVRRRIKKQKL